MSLQKIISKTGEYLSVPAVVRFEHPFINHLADDFNTSGYDIEQQDRLLVVRKKGIRNQRIRAKARRKRGVNRLRKRIMVKVIITYPTKSLVFNPFLRSLLSLPSSASCGKMGIPLSTK